MRESWQPPQAPPNWSDRHLLNEKETKPVVHRATLIKAVHLFIGLAAIVALMLVTVALARVNSISNEVQYLEQEKISSLLARGYMQDALADTRLQIAVLEHELSYAIEAINQRVPDCSEDVVILGAGEFESGQWDRYLCGPAVDDYEEVRP